MQYLTYDEYKELGGVCDQTAFNRNIDRACGVIDNETHGRVETLAVIPNQIKALCRDLIEYMATNSVTEKGVSSKSQSANGVSESESYTVKTKDEQAKDIEELVFDYLGALIDDNGVPLLYRGCGR